MVRRELQKQHQAATVIQSTYKMYKVKMQFQAMRLAAVLIQRQLRSHLKRKEEREGYLRMRRSAIIIQAVFRGNRTRQEISKMQVAATLIQRTYRAHQDRKRFLALRAAVKLTQQVYRSVLLGRQTRQEFLAKRNATIVMQAYFRGMKVRQQMRIKTKAALTIQAHIRRYLCQRQYSRTLWAVKTLQRRHIANRMMKHEMEALSRKKRAILLLQAAFRGMKTRQALKRQHEASIIIQKTFRAHCARTRFLCMRYAAISIQRLFRCTITARKQRQQFMRMRQAAITLQSHFRGQKVRKDLMLQHRAATSIQAVFRKHREVSKYQAMRLSATIIQRFYRSYIKCKRTRDQYVQLRRAVVVLQAAFRGYSVRQHISKMHRAATVIQSAVRMHHQRAMFQKQQWAANVLQKRFRVWKVGHQQRESYQKLKCAALCLQKNFRAKRARQLYKQTRAARKIQAFLKMAVQRRHFLKTKAATVVIQSAYRRHLCMLQFSKMQKSVVCIQRWYRSSKQTQIQRNGFKAIQRATLTLQRAARRMLAKRHFRRKLAAIKIQSVMLMNVQRRRYLKLRWCAVRLQAHYRTLRARRSYLSYRAAAVTIQRCYRGHMATVAQRQQYIKTLDSVRTLQAQVRGFLMQRRFQKMRSSAITIQTFYRGLLERRKFQRVKNSACLIQKHFRAGQQCRRERAHFLKLRTSAILIQTQFRTYRSRKHTMQTQAAVKIQAWFRGRRVRRVYVSKRAAIATVHRCMQVRRQRLRFQTVQHSVRLIQKRWRETLLARKQRSEFLRSQKSAVVIQAWWRGSRVRRTVLKEQSAAVVIQSAFRAHRQRRTFRLQRASAILLQRRFRALQRVRAEQKHQQRCNSAAVTIQAFCRGWIARQRLKEEASAARRLRFTAAAYHHLCAVKIQRALKAHWTLTAAKKQIAFIIYIQQWFRAKLLRKKYLEQRQKILTVQRAVRAWLQRRNEAAVLIQRVAKRFLMGRRKERMKNAFIKFQALWRGHQSRKLCDTKKVVLIRHRLRKINQEAKEEDKLCNKTTMALSYLLGYQNYAHILVALQHLETASRLSPECCERLVNSGVTLTLFTLIRSCNRSVPSMEIISLTIQVLLNLSKYNKTIEAVYEVKDSVETLLDLLQMYREKAGDKVADKGGSIFTKACFLLVILVQNQSRALDVKKIPRAADRISRIYQLTLQKFKMDTRRTKVKEKMNLSLNGSFLPQATPRKSKPAVGFAPDWVLRKGKMKNLVDPLGSIQMLVSTLGLRP